MTHSPRMLLPMLIAALCVGAGGLLIWAAPSDASSIRIVGAIGILLGCVASFQFLVTNKPITVAEDHLRIGDQRYPWAEVVLSEPTERKVKGRPVREFDLDLHPQGGESRKLRINSNIYPDFDGLYAQIREKKGLDRPT